jgi:hypothetical protein
MLPDFNNEALWRNIVTVKIIRRFEGAAHTKTSWKDKNVEI